MTTRALTLAALLLAFASTTLSGTALAEDEPAAQGEGAQSGDLDDLLGSIPEIENPGAEAVDDSPDVPDVPFTTYVDQVRAQVLDVWKPKKGLAKKNASLETRLVLIIAEDGQVTDLKPMVLSGEKKWDQDAVDAVNDAGDMPAPAPNLRTVAQEGVVVVFSASAFLRGK